MTALEDLNGLLANLPGYGLITDSMKTSALLQSLVPDSFGLWPGEVGYELTYDVYFAAGNLLTFLMAQPVVRQTSSEGTSVAVDAPNWSGLAAYYRSQSLILGGASQDVLRLVAIPDVPHVVKQNMSGYDSLGRGTDDGNVDTDIG